MPAYSAPTTFVLAVAIAVVVGVSPMLAQTPVVHDMPSLGLPAGEPTELRYGPSGGTFALIADEHHGKIFVYDGNGWEICLELSARDAVVPTVNGELILLNDGELYTYQWRFRAPPVRRRIGRIPKGEFVALAMRSTNQTSSTRTAQGFEGVVAIETGSGIFTCADGSCKRVTARATQLLGAWDGDMYAVDADGGVSCVGQAGALAISLPPRC